MSKIIDDFLNCNRSNRPVIHCVGDAMIDEYYDVKVNRISPEFPMPIMHSKDHSVTLRPGGAANVAAQFRHFDVYAKLFCFPDRVANRVFLSYDNDFDTHWHSNSLNLNATLPVKRRFLDNGIQVTRHDIEVPNCGLTEQEINIVVTDLGKYLGEKKHDVNVAILSDYNKGFFLSPRRVLEFYKGVKTIVDPKKGPLEKWQGCTIFKPNAVEAEALTGLKDWRVQSKYIQKVLGCESVVITQNSQQVAGIHKGEFFIHQSTPVNVDSVVGAGDCFSAFLAMAVAHGFEIPEAVEIADTASSVYVQHRMNRPVCPAELVTHQIVNPEDLYNRDFRLVFTNGCFDILHKGHLDTLKFAKSKGEKLVVALNSDESIKRLKGDSRPIVPLEQRLAVMANLKDVDFVCSFDEDTPLEIIKKIRPDVLVKGGQYELEKIVGADIVPEVYRAPMIDGLSTTSILSKT